MKVYKNEDVNNPEYATLEEVAQAFFGRGIVIKHRDGIYYKVTAFNPENGELMSNSTHYQTQETLDM